MFKRTILAAAAACALVVSTQAQESATLVMRSGEKVTGQLVDMGGVGLHGPGERTGASDPDQ